MTGRGRLALAAGVLLVCALIIVVIIFLRRPVVAGRTDAASKAVRAQSGEVKISLRSDGFAPSEVTHTAENFNLTVVNESGEPKLILRIVSENGDLVQEIRINKGERQWSGMLFLPEGNYFLTEANHAAWLFHISIQ